MTLESEGKIVPDQTLDVRGMGCPMPLLKAKKAFDSLKTGQVLEVLGTDQGSKNDFPSWADKTGNEYLGCLDEAGYFRFYLKKSNGQWTPRSLRSGRRQRDATRRKRYM